MTRELNTVEQKFKRDLQSVLNRQPASCAIFCEAGGSIIIVDAKEFKEWQSGNEDRNLNDIEMDNVETKGAYDCGGI